MSTNSKFLFLFIFFLALFLRFINLSQYPAGFHSDEASVGYNAYSLFETAKDDNGKKFPLYIDIFGDNRLAGIHYLSILPVKFFGLNEFATRFSAALFGALTVIPFYFLAQGIFQNRKVSFIASLILSVAPWSLVFSRATSEAIIAVFFLILGFACVIYGMRTNKNIFYIWAGIILSISFFFYHTPRIFIPLLLFSILAFFFFTEKLKENYFVKVTIVFMVLSVVAFSLIFLVSGGTSRFNQVNIFSSFETDFQLKRQLQQDAIAGSPKYISRIMHNKITNVTYTFISNYIDYFSGNFLFLKGGLPLWYLIPRAGVLLLIELPFLLYGIYYLISSKEKMHKIPLVWIFIAPIIPAITLDDIPNIHRSIALFPFLNLIAAAGFVFFLERFKKTRQTILACLIGCLLFLNVAYFLHQYFFNAKVEKPWYRNNGFGAMMSIVKKSYASYDKVVMTKYQGETYPLVLFYMQYDPKEYQNEGSPKARDYGGFGKFFFAPQDCPSVQTSEKTPNAPRILFIDKGDCPMDKSLEHKRLEYVYREDGTKAFRIIY